MKLQILLLCYISCFLRTSAFNVQPSLLLTKQQIPHQIRHYVPPVGASNQENSAVDDSALREGIDKAWRYLPKPLLRIGGKGVSDSHGNSLKELLNAHTAVKVKINSSKLGSLEDVFEILKAQVEKKGNISGVELLHIRKSENTIMLGKNGTMKEILEGKFPPAKDVGEKGATDSFSS